MSQNLDSARPSATPSAPAPYQLRRIRQIVETGGVIAYPTEAVYGLGCDPANLWAVAHLLQLKGRDWRKGLILIAANRAQLDPWVSLDEPEWQALEQQWPGPRTWVVPARPGTPDWITGGRSEIAVRITAHPTVRSLCMACDSALVSTSANPDGRPPARSALMVRRYFADRLDGIVAGPIDRRANPTAIRHWPDGQWLRRG